ncbi:protein tyrosine phosphatase family protein [Chamaesiphon sp. GL140_3_metabinner_50]|uniref:protein tyrosine phosphatase family protein n=1 Tax=Chamaesiphon sp. GL140_3_metabinner_50 TaxID=2970812 RepID=UPI0025CE9908|nr:protein tyrosine phosphatase family protein [Chamaesiphon sp. GL140_3_metabinner_50]
MGTQIENITNFLQIYDRLATAGQPTVEQYSAIVSAGYRVVVNLALNDSPNALADEASLARQLGLEYIQIPVEWNAPTIEDFQAFRTVMDAHSADKIFVHCAANKRVSAFVYLYRICQGVEEPSAHQDLTKIWTLNEIWAKFIDRVRSSI